jgi:hypothetical protein
MVEKLRILFTPHHAAVCANVEHPRIKAIPRQVVCETVRNKRLAPCRQSDHDDEELLAACKHQRVRILFRVSIEGLGFRVLFRFSTEVLEVAI